jgi:[ribosomal protein S18]-alanine N-acetyltransferase
MGYHIRALTRKDIPEVLGIENESYQNPWTEEELVCHIRNRNAGGKVVEFNELVLGFMVYELRKTSTRILNLAVGWDYRRACVGTAMIGKLASELKSDRRMAIECDVAAVNLDGQLFLKSLGFVAVKQRRGGDEYRFRYEKGRVCLPIYDDLDKGDDLILWWGNEQLSGEFAGLSRDESGELLVLMSTEKYGSMGILRRDIVSIKKLQRSEAGEKGSRDKV